MSYLQSQFQFNHTANGFYLDYVILYGIPNTTASFYFSTITIKNANESYPYIFRTTYYYELLVNFRPCLYGETLVKLEKSDICHECKPKFYSLIFPSVNNPGICSQCPYNHISCEGGAKIEV